MLEALLILACCFSFHPKESSLAVGDLAVASVMNVHAEPARIVAVEGSLVAPAVDATVR